MSYSTETTVYKQDRIAKMRIVGIMGSPSGNNVKNKL